MLVVIPVCSKDFSLALRNLDWCMTLDGHCEFRCLISHENDFDASALVEKAALYFVGIDEFKYDPWRGEVNWPAPQNNAWQEVARHIEAKYRSPWFFWEQDAIPLKPGWLALINAAHTQGGRVFSGPVTSLMGQFYMAGNSVYPWNISHHATSALLTSSQPWDIAGSTRDGWLRKAHDLANLICHTPDRNNTTFENPEDISRLIPESAVLFHKCKDGSLLDVLQGCSQEKPQVFVLKSSNPRVNDPKPSFTEQTSWPSGYFTFPFSSNTCYFNASIAERDNCYWLFTRRYRFNRGPETGDQCDLAIWKIRENMSLHSQPIIPAIPQRYNHEQWEDPRAYTENGTCYVSFSTWVHYKTWMIRQSFTRLTPDWRRIEVLFEPIYGGNASRPEQAKSHEKNWVWFKRDDHWHCVYKPQPHIVFQVDDRGTVLQEWKRKSLDLPWGYGEIRGGTPPVIIGDEYLCFFHSALVWQKPKRRYFVGAYTFDAKPPFDFRRMTLEPLLIGSEEDFRVLGGPLVIFPNGALLTEKREWLVVFGVNDENCGWIRIPWQDLEAKLELVNAKSFLRKAAEFVGADV